jgi:glycosyltransferase involved in cell wall biosynthesis
MSIQLPKVSIGLPVYNGENFIQEAIESILNQTFEDFELILSDNASTDETAAICRTYVAQDRRVRYYRNSENIGATGNYNHVFALSSGEYFKWAHHDDVCEPTFLTECVNVLDQDPTIVLCYARTTIIDTQGRPVKQSEAIPETNSTRPDVRFREVLNGEIFQSSCPILGLIRADVLRRTPVFGYYPAHDLSLLAELSLHGRFYEIPEFLFCIRDHSQRSMRTYDYRQPHKAMAWFAPKQAGKLIFPAWRLLTEYIASIHRVSLKAHEQIACYGAIAIWLTNHQRDLVRDLIIATEYLPGIGSRLAKFYEQRSAANWLRQVKQAVKELAAIIPPQETLILIDENTLEKETFTQWQTFPFLEHEGQYWGLPADDGTAIQELERLRQAGANFIVFAWTSFWCFDHYSQFNDYLRSKFSCIEENDHFVVFNLQRELAGIHQHQPRGSGSLKVG